MPRLSFRALIAAFTLAAVFAPTAHAAPKPAGREWLVLVYVSAVNERGIDGSARDLINQLEKHGSTDAVTILAKYAILEKDTRESPLFPREARTVLIGCDHGDPAITSPQVDVSPSPDMASKTSLALFCRKGMRQYPARKTLLLFFGTGDGLAGLGRDDLAQKSFGVAELARILGGVVREAGRPFDMLALDADGMQMAEIAYELRDVAKVIVGHEERGPRKSMLWDLALGDLLWRPDWDAAKFAHSVTYYSDNPATSAIDTGKLEPFLKLLDRFVAATLADPAALAAARAALGKALAYRLKNARDLGDFVMRTCEALPTEAPSFQAGRDLLKFLDTELVVSSHATLEDSDTRKMIEAPDYKRQRGLAVHLPEVAYDSAACEGLAFAARSRWYDLVLALLAPPRK